MLGGALNALGGQSAYSVAEEAGIDLGPRSTAKMSKAEVEKLLYFQRGQAHRIDRQGRLFLRFEEYAQAEPLLVQAAQFWRNMEGEDSLQLAQALASLALLHEQCFRWSKAISLREQAQKIFSDANRTADHVQVLNENGLACRYTGKHNEALARFHESAKISEEVFGPNSGEFATAMLHAMEENLIMGEPLDALSLGSKCKKVRVMRLEAIRSGPPPPPGAEDAEEIELTTVRLALVRSKVALTMLEEADIELRELLADHQKVREERALRHIDPPPHHAEPMLFFAKFQRLLGDVPGAKVALESCRAVLIAAIGTDDAVDMAEVLLEGAELDFADGDLAGALEKTTRAVDVRAKFLGTEHPSVALAMAKRAEALAQSGEEAMAVQVGEEAARILSVTLGGSTLQDVELCQRRLLWSMAVSPNVEAAELLNQAISIRENEFGEFRAIELKRRAALAHLEGRAGGSDAVDDCIKALLDIRRSLKQIRMDRDQRCLWPRADYEYAIISGVLCEISRMAKKLQDAEDYLALELIILEDVIGTFHPDYAAAVLRRARLHEHWAKSRPSGKEIAMAEMFFNDAAAMFCETTIYASVVGSLEDRLWNIDRMQAVASVYVNMLFDNGMNFQEVPAWRCFEMSTRLRSLRFGCPEMFALEGLTESNTVAVELRKQRRLMAFRLIQGPGKGQEETRASAQIISTIGDEEEEEEKPLSEYARELKLLKLNIEALRSQLIVSCPALGHWDTRFTARGFSLVWRLPPGTILLDFMPFREHYAVFVIEGQEPDRCGAFKAGPRRKIDHLCKVIGDAVLEEALVLEYRENIQLLPSPLRDGMLPLLDAMDSDDTPLAIQIERKLRGSRERFVKAGDTLRKMLLGPMYKFRAERRHADAQVPPLKQIVICGDGPVLQLPWAALPESAEIDAKPLLHKHAFSTILSSVDLHHYGAKRTNPLLKRLSQDVKTGQDTTFKSLAAKRWTKAKIRIGGAVKVQQATSFVRAFKNMELSPGPAIFQYTVPRGQPRPKVLDHVNLLRTPPSYVTGLVHSDVLSMVWRYGSYPETNQWSPQSSPSNSRRSRSRKDLGSPAGMATLELNGDRPVHNKVSDQLESSDPLSPLSPTSPTSPTSPIFPMSPAESTDSSFRKTGMSGFRQNSPSPLQASPPASPLRPSRSGIRITEPTSPNSRGGTGNWDPRNPETSEFFAGMTDEPPAKTGKITLKDPAFKSGYKASMLFCKRCVTERGLVDAGDGLSVMLNSLLQGSESIIMCLWRMPQNCVKETLSQTASAMIAGKNRAESLQSGMQKTEESMRYRLLDGKEMPGPAWAWAGFLLVGNPGSITPFDTVETAELANYTGD